MANQEMLAVMNILFAHLTGGQFDPAAEARAKAELFAAGPRALPPLVERLGDPGFPIKKRAYNLIVEMGEKGAIHAHDLPLPPQPAVRLWLNGVLRVWHAGGPDMRVRELLDSDDAYARHLAALSLAFLGELQGDPARRAVPILIDALDDMSNLEGSGATVAGTALTVLSDLSGRKFFPGQADVGYYNFNDLLFPPPVAPFPLTGDQVATNPPETRREIRAAVERWWSEVKDAPEPVRSLPDPFAEKR